VNIYRSPEFEGPRAGLRQPPPLSVKAPARSAEPRPTFDATSYYSLASQQYSRHAAYLARRVYARAVDDETRAQLRRSIANARERQAWHAAQSRDPRAVAALPAEVREFAAASLAAIRASAATGDATAKRELAARAQRLLRAAGEALRAHRTNAAAVSCKGNS
jgi:hypothetical protein